jgi:hypothetical protein
LQEVKRGARNMAVMAQEDKEKPGLLVTCQFFNGYPLQ